VRRYGLTALRVSVAAIFVGHGAQKLLGLWGGPGLTGTAAMLTALHLPYPYPLAGLLALTELGGGLLLMLGWLTPWVSLALFADMAMAIWKVHYANGFFMNWSATPGRGHGVEYVLVLAGALLCLALMGPGPLSVDDWRDQSAEARARGRARARKV
jgi:putative oxidoreductase